MTFREAKPGVLISYINLRWLFLVKNKDSIKSVFVKTDGSFFSVPKLFKLPKKSFSEDKNIFVRGPGPRGEPVAGEEKFNFIKLLIRKIFTAGIEDDDI